MEAVTTALTSGFTSAAGDILPVIAVAVTAAIGVIGVKIAAKSGISFFSSLAKKN